MKFASQNTSERFLDKAGISELKLEKYVLLKSKVCDVEHPKQVLMVCHKCICQVVIDKAVDQWPKPVALTIWAHRGRNEHQLDR